jgi:amino acid adenylation domain-containing protein
MSGLPFRHDATIHELIAEQALATPDRIALIDTEQRLTYSELEARANRLAQLLRRHGVTCERTVGVCLERSNDLIVALLAVLKAGGTYLPLDPKYPRDRVLFMLEDARAQWVITRRELDHLFAEGHGRDTEKLYLEELGDHLATQPETAPEEQTESGALAYLIYTSGSTGRPKGVAITHRNAVALFAWAERLFPAEELEGVFAATSVCFDLSIFEIFFPLESGGTVIVGNDALHLRTHPARELVTLVNTVPSAITELARLRAIPPSVITVNLAGEPLKRALTDQVYAPGTVRKVYNLYGPSEDTTYSTWVLVPRDVAEEPTIGLPIDRTEGYVVDPGGELRAGGEIGELWLGGEGVARCYLGRPAITAEKFVPDPWSGRAGARLYRTGDRVRWRPDGELDYLGRFDHQVKIRGFRIELGEIEAALARHANVEMPLALVREDQPGDKRVVAYFQPRGPVPSAGELRALLLESLPAYMVPAAFVPLEKMPLTPNGKIDRNVLQKIPPTAAHTLADPSMVEPRTDLERRLAELFAATLGVERVGIETSFFELGGHSLSAARIVAALGDELGIDVGQGQLFATPTVAGLAAFVEAWQGEGRQERAAIPRIERQGELPISPAQRGLWFLRRLDQGSPRYNIPVGVILHSALDTAALGQALDALIERHEALRMRIVDTAFSGPEARAGRPSAEIDPPFSLELHVEDLGGWPDPEAQARRIALEEANAGFDLGRDHLIRARLLRLDAERHVLLVIQHHVISDGISLEIYFRELGLLYQAFASGQEPALPALPIQMVDAVAFAASQLADGGDERLLAFWREYLAGHDREAFALPLDRPRPAQLAFRGDRVVLPIEASLVAGLNAIARQHDATLFMVAAAALGVWLARLTGVRDLLFGAPFANRSRAELENVVGFLINTLPVRIRFEGDPTFGELVRTVRQSTLEVFAHQELSFERIVEALSPQRAMNRNAFYDLTFQVRNGYFGDDLLPGLRAEWLPIHNGTSKIDLDFALVRDGGGLRAEVDFDTELFARPSLEALLDSWLQGMRAVARQPELRLSQIDMVSAAQRAAMAAWNDTRGTAPLERSLPELFAEVVERHSERPALTYEGRTLSYRELEQASRGLAHRLRAAGVGPGDAVAVSLERSTQLIVAFLAAIRAGAAYVPLDATYPADRIAFMLEDAAAKVLVSRRAAISGGLSQTSLDDFVAHGGVLIDVDIAGEADETAELPVVGDPELPAYVIYTSGSTGKPKGVTVCQRNIVRLTFDNRFYPFCPDDRIAQISNASFDAATYEIWGAFLHGGHLVGVDRETLLSPSALRELFARERITTLFMTAALFQQYAGQEPGLFRGIRKLLVGGDRVDPAAARAVLADGPEQLTNGYGPTETTTFAVTWDIEDLPADALSVPIGKPLGETELLVIDSWGGRAPIGAFGELWIGGEGVAHGYHRRPALTAKAFAPHPEAPEPGARVYRTGDLVRLLPNGLVDYVGRIDQQVKVRGFRIELGEIESQLSRHPDVLERVVVAQSDGQGGKRLAAYVAARPGSALDADALARFLGETLPAYMVPAAYLVLDRLPLTPNGKVDRKALPPIPAAGAGEAGQAQSGPRPSTPRSPFEQAMHDAWSDLLKAGQLPVEADFFALGGHSLLAIRLISRLKDIFGIELPVTALYQHGTIARLTVEIERRLLAEVAERAGVQRTLIPRRAPNATTPATFGQRALYFLDQLERSAAYNMPWALDLRGALDVPALQRALDHLVARHEALRTHFDEGYDSVVQVVEPPRPVLITVTDLSGAGDGPELEAAIDAALARAATEPFDLRRGPLLRVDLLRASADRNVLSLVIHHSVSDGWSEGIILRELAALYASFQAGEPPKLGPPPLQYGDFAVWQEQGDWQRLEADAAFWRRRLAGLEPLDLPTDFPRPATVATRGGLINAELPPDLLIAARQFAKSQGVTLFTVMLAAFNAWLGRICHTRDVLVGTPHAGRRLRELEDVVGYFVNMVVLRTQWGAETDFRGLVRATADTVTSAQDHASAPFDRVVKEAGVPRDPARHPLFSVLFQLFEMELRSEFGGLTSVVRSEHSGTSKFDVTFGVMGDGETFEIGAEYRTDLFTAATIRRWIDGFVEVLRAGVTRPDTRVARLPLVSAGDHARLAAWNATEATFDREALLTSAFRRMAAEQPHATALIAGDQELTYHELAGRVDELAALLRRYGVGRERLVAICLERRAELVIALLAVLEAGGAYVPLDLNYPLARLSATLEDSGAELLLTHSSLLDILPADRPTTLRLDALPWTEGAPAEMASAPADAESLAYLIYTSGSTGKPKGVAIRHRNAVAMVAWALERFPPEELAFTLAGTSICFDLSIFEIFAPLSAGATVVLADSALELPRLPARERLTLVNTVPSVLREVLRHGELPASVRTVNLAGEPLPGDLVDTLYAGGIAKVYNLYGPSEDTTYSTESLTHAGETPRIGRPLANRRAYVLDAGLERMPIGVPGELFLAGDGVTRGYLGRPGITAERFLPDPFGAPGARFYRTGDLVRFGEDGELVYHGRTDRQVKVRGFRIELQEVESTLARHPAIAELAVTTQPDTEGSLVLVAFFVAAEGAEMPEAAELREHLRARLPEFMVPAVYLPLPALPLTPNGKIDRRALPHFLELTSSTAGRAPATEAESRVYEAVADVLGRHDFSIDSSFFELGGHSLIATRVLSRINERLGIELALRELYDSSSLAAIASLAEQRGAEQRGTAVEPTSAAPPATPGKPILPPGPRRLSFAQRSLLFQAALEPGSSAYNMPLGWRLRGPLRVDWLRQALTALTARHEVLRTRFSRLDTEAEPIAADLGPPLVVRSLKGSPREREETLGALLRQEATLPFDLVKELPLRATLVALAPDDHVLLLTLHHIAADGWSLHLMAEELAAYYAALEAGQPPGLPPLPLQYGEVAQRQLRAAETSPDLAFWQRQLAGAPAVLELPTDRPRPAMPSHRGRALTVELDPALQEAAEALGRRYQATPFVTFLATVATLLARVSGQLDLTLGAPMAGRRQVDLEPLIGNFVNAVTLRLRLRPGMSFGDLLKEARNVTLEAIGHQDLPFDRVVELLAPQRSLHHHPLFQVSCQWLDQVFAPPRLGSLAVEELDLETTTAKFDLEWTFQSREGAPLVLTVIFAEDLFDETTIARWVGSFRTLLAAAAADPERPVTELPLIAGEERAAVLRRGVGAAGELFGDEGLIDFFARQVAAAPEALAIVDGERRLSYGELDLLTNQAARALRAHGVPPGGMAVLWMERSLELVVAMLGALKASAAYAPLDRAAPPGRLDAMARDLGAMAIFYHQAPPHSELPAIDLIDALPVQSAAPLPLAVDGEWPAYALFTSGSTGQPKAVIVRQRAVLNLVLNDGFHRPAADEVVAHASNPSFDAATWEIWSAFLTGRPLIVVRRETVLQPSAMAAYYQEHGVTLSFFTTAFLQQLIQTAPTLLGGLRTVVFGGETCDPQRVAQARALVPGRLLNAYGPTEATTITTLQPIDDADRLTAEDPVPIARPLDGAQLYVLDRWGHPVPEGTVGELFIGGEGLALGYWRRARQTALAFQPDAFGRRPGARLYGTGDLVRWRADGALEFVGRRDFQVKLRGFRIELGEVETALSQHPAVLERAAVVRTLGGEQRLVAYVRLRAPVAESELREHLRGLLPGFMVPSDLVFLDTLPLTANGKLDLAALPDPPPRARGGQTPAVDALERLLAEIWAGVLGVDLPGREDNFFALGGHSLHATSVFAAIEDQLGQQLPLRALFESATLADLAASLRRSLELNADGRAVLEQLAELDAMSEQERSALLA